MQPKALQDSRNGLLHPRVALSGRPVLWHGYKGLTRHRKSQLSSRLDQQGGAMVIDEFFDDQNGFMEEFSVAAAIIDEQANDLLADE
mmetsp:Transcript_9283/g.21923  ORF Transcript_9283/g.21923 Transcript_9283/m.21923 type:complete len:87 (+) Transcript_9283:473-733(+)